MILVVDDNYLIGETVKNICSSLNVQFEIVQTGEEAIERCRDHRYALILMDLNLAGGMCGVEAAIKIHELPNGNVPIVALSGLAPVPGIHRWDEAKFVGMLVKPFSVSDFAHMVEMYDHSRRP